MSLINLLTVGATFRGVKDRSGSYKLASVAPLPIFGAAKTGTTPPGARKEPISDAVDWSQGSLLDPAPAAAPRQRHAVKQVKPQEVMGTQLQAGRSPNILGVGSEGTTDLPASFPPRLIPPPVQAPPPDGATPVPKMPAPAVRSPMAGVKRLVNQFLFGRPPRSSPAATVQTELALEKVTVVRNDLSEEGRPGGASSRKGGATTKMDAAETIGSWFNLTACFGKPAAPSTERPAANVTEAHEPGLVARI